MEKKREKEEGKERRNKKKRKKKKTIIIYNILDPILSNALPHQFSVVSFSSLYPQEYQYLQYQ